MRYRKPPGKQLPVKSVLSRDDCSFAAEPVAADRMSVLAQRVDNSCSRDQHAGSASELRHTHSMTQQGPRADSTAQAAGGGNGKAYCCRHVPLAVFLFHSHK